MYNQAIGKRLSAIQEKGAKLTGEETQILEKVGIPKINMDLPTVPGLQLPETSNLPDVGLNKPEVQMPGVEIPSVEPNMKDINAPQVKKLDIPGMPGEVEDAQNIVKEVSELGKQAGDASKDIERLKKEGLEEVKNTDVDKVADQGLTKIDGVSELKSQADAAEKMKQLQQLELDKIKNSQNLRDQASSKLATNKVLANEELVKGYMEKMGKHKKKFDNLADMRYVPKIKPNEMKGKPLKERIVPGVLIQIQKINDQIAWYLAPEVLYKFSGTFSAGIGGLYCLRYTTTPKMIWSDPVYGYKLIGQAKVYKSFYARTEFERNSIVLPVNSADGKRMWQSN